MIALVPQDQLVEAAIAVAADQIDRGFIGAGAAPHHAVLAAAQADVIGLNAIGEARALGVGEAASDRKSLEQEPGRRRAMRAASSEQEQEREPWCLMCHQMRASGCWCD
ncbi:hypothetical protein GCM10009087_39860 [Sphingomonas oligophenolica]